MMPLTFSIADGIGMGFISYAVLCLLTGKVERTTLSVWVLALIFLRVPIGLAMLGVGLAGSWMITGTPIPVVAQFKNLTYGTYASYSLSVVPLFLAVNHRRDRYIAA